MWPKFFECGRGFALEAFFGFGEFDDGGVHADFKDFGGGGQAAVFTVVHQVRAVTADRGEDGEAGFRVRADGARQRQQADRCFKVEACCVNVLGDR